MKFEIKYNGYKEDKDWNHFEWSVKINTETFIYSTGIGHATYFETRQGHKNQKPLNSLRIQDMNLWAHIPKENDILECLFSDADCGQYSFNEFCDNLGYDNDSLKALDTYRACMETITKLKKALGTEYNSIKAKIQKEDGK